MSKKDKKQAERGRKGGYATLKKYGKKFLIENAKKGAKKRWAKHKKKAKKKKAKKTKVKAKIKWARYNHKWVM